MAAIMDALAGAIPAADATNVYPHPVGSVTSPAVVVGYPTELEFDATYHRGSDRVVFPVYFVRGMVTDKAARNAISATISGASEIKSAIESNTTLLTKVQTARVTDAAFQSMTIGAVEYIAVRFDVEVYT